MKLSQYTRFIDIMNNIIFSVIMCELQVMKML